METILQLNTSLFGDDGQSSQLGAALVERLRGTGATPSATPQGGRVIVRDLAANPVPHLTAERFKAFTTPASERTLDQQRIVAESDALIAELKAADVIVIGLPMYNFGIPSTLKAYFDHVARAGVTFRYTPEGPVGLLKGKRVYVVATRGGRHAGTPRDLQSAFLRQFLGFVGIDDVQFVYAEGLALGPEQRAEALDSVDRRIRELAA